MTLNVGEKPREPVITKLSDILEENADPKYQLSAKACRGILNRAAKRGKELPKELKEALEAQAAPDEEEKEVSQMDAVSVDVYNQTVDGSVTSTVTAAVGGTNTSGPKVLSAGFSFGQSAQARSIGYEEEISPTLRGGEGGNQKPCALICEKEEEEFDWL